MSRICIAYQLHGNNIKYIAFHTVFSVNIVDWLMFFTRKCLSKKATTVTMHVDSFVKPNFIRAE